MSSTDYPCRVILLLDLDCFYAQCERVRLGLDSDTCSLALLQWNSTLAVTYPARRLFDIKRGDSWDVIAQKSKGKCLAIHLPLLKPGQKNTLNMDIDSCDVEGMYEKVFHLSNEQRQLVLNTEIGKRRSNTEGKACLERYRLASTRIFGIVLQALKQILGNISFILERASIDELFLDVTKFCWAPDVARDNGERTGMEGPNNDGIEAVVAETIIVGNGKGSLGMEHDDPSVQKALRKGAWVARTIRQSVFDEVGFTLSAGISTSKLVAKLGASYGKPNGQSIIYPSKIPFVMNETKIWKVRNLGGKLGKKVIEMLPDVEPTMGNIAQHLSLPELVHSIGKESAQLVFESARGMDQEEVKATEGVLAKSITAFKSFYQAKLDSPVVRNWFELLADDVFARVKQDSKRNNRYPKSCNVNFTCSYKVKAHDKRKDRVSKCIRITFPKETDNDKASILVERAIRTIQSREGENIFLHRIGLCAIDFETRATGGGIASFFGKSSSTQTAQKEGSKDKSTDSSLNDVCLELSKFDRFEKKTRPSIPTKTKGEAKGPTPTFLQEDIVDKAITQFVDPSETTIPSSNNCNFEVNAPTKLEIDRDLMLARKLQASYDRENSVLSRLDRTKPPAKRLKIDSFFKCKR